MKKGWYILNYHGISWEENLLQRGLVGCLPPDIFRDHLEKLNQSFKLVSVQEGFKLYSQNKIDEPLLSFWFDDGLLGIRKYASPLLEKHGVKGAMSVNSRFTLRKEFFWRYKLSLLSCSDGLRFLRNRLRELGYKPGMSLKEFTLNSFSEKMLSIVDSLYNDFTNDSFRRDAYRIFDTIDGIRELLNNGWVIANHTASHYPLDAETHFDRFKEQFFECENDLQQHLGIEPLFWVVPFGGKNVEKLLKIFRDINRKEKHFVLVGNKVNTSCDEQDRLIYRISVPLCNGNRLVNFLRWMS